MVRVPMLGKKWVIPETWIRISEDILDPKDKTEGGPPNDIAIKAFLRSEGKYEGRRQYGGKIIQDNVKKRLEALVYETKASHKGLRAVHGSMEQDCNAIARL